MAWPQTVRREDLRIEFKRGSGAGGQNRNKRDTACRMTHIPTGMSAVAEDQRTQEQNKRTCFQRLAAKLVPLMVAAAKRGPVLTNEELKALPTIRTYHEPDNRVIDVRLPHTQWSYESVIYKAGLGNIIDSLARKAND